MAAFDSGDLILILIAIFFPPVTAVITDGCGGQFCINILLTILGFIPGLVHAIWLVYRKAEREQAAGLRNSGRPGGPIYVQQPSHGHHHPHQDRYNQGPQNYGAVPPHVEPQYAPAAAPAPAGGMKA